MMGKKKRQGKDLHADTVEKNGDIISVTVYPLRQIWRRSSLEKMAASVV